MLGGGDLNTKNPLKAVENTFGWLGVMPED